MTQFYAQPYDISATGFYFETVDEYTQKAAKAKNGYGQKVEEFEIQFIDGEMIDVQTCEALGINQGNIQKIMELLDEWDDDQKRAIIIAVGGCYSHFDVETDDPDDIDIDLYEMDTIRELAEHFVDEGLFGEIPPQLIFYIDYDAIARDLSVDYTETTIAGQCLIYALR